MNEIKSLNMSHLSEDAYVSKIEKTEQTDNVKKESCHYELHDGSWLCIETLYEAKDEEWGKNWKKVKTKSSSCDEKPGSATKEDHMKRLMEYAGKLKV
jgi:hypothetical protein